MINIPQPKQQHRFNVSFELDELDSHLSDALSINVLSIGDAPGQPDDVLVVRFHDDVTNDVIRALKVLSGAMSRAITIRLHQLDNAENILATWVYDFANLNAFGIEKQDYSTSEYTVITALFSYDAWDVELPEDMDNEEA